MNVTIVLIQLHSVLLKIILLILDSDEKVTGYVHMFQARDYQESNDRRRK